MPNGALPLRSVDSTRLSFQNFVIRMPRRKRGPGAASSHAGLRATQVGEKDRRFKISTGRGIAFAAILANKQTPEGDPLRII